MARPDRMIWPTLLDLAGCLEQEFADQDTCFLGVLHGQAAPWDYGLDGLMVWVRLSGAYPSTTFPSPDQDLVGCPKPLAFEVEVGALRCASTPDDSGNLPTAADQDEVAEQATGDMAALYAAIACCFGRGGRKRFQDVVIGSYTPLGPAGGVTGGTWTLTVGGEA